MPLHNTKDPTAGYCEAIVGWNIEKGHCGDVSLDGINVGVWLHSPGNLTKGNWRLALYVDENANDAQFDAICSLWSGEGGGHLAVIASLVSEVMSAMKAKISFESRTDPITDCSASMLFGSSSNLFFTRFNDCIMIKIIKY